MYFNDINEKIIYVDISENTPMMGCVLAGITYPNPEYRINRFPSKEYVFEYVISGKGYIESDGQKYEVSRGDFYAFRRGTELLYYADPDEPYEKIWMNFVGEMPERLFTFFSLDSIFIKNCNVLDIFLEIHDALERITAKNKSDTFRDVLNLLFRALTEATKDRFFPSSADKSSLDERIRAFIDANVYTDISLDRISEEFGITKMHIIRVFKNKFGITPMQYLIDRKIGIAKSLLTGTVMPIKEIAALLRYSNTQHFSGSFKSAVGCTPNKYRQSKHHAQR